MTKAEWFRQYYSRLTAEQRSAMNNKKNDARRGMPKKPRKAIKGKQKKSRAAKFKILNLGKSLR
jgi:hypothetical protein